MAQYSAIRDPFGSIRCPIRATIPKQRVCNHRTKQDVPKVPDVNCGHGINKSKTQSCVRLQTTAQVRQHNGQTKCESPACTTIFSARTRNRLAQFQKTFAWGWPNSQTKIQDAQCKPNQTRIKVHTSLTTSNNGTLRVKWTPCGFLGLGRANGISDTRNNTTTRDLVGTY